MSEETVTSIPDNAQVTCNVVLGTIVAPDETNQYILCGEIITDFFTIANDAVLPICPKHMDRFEQGSTFVVQEVIGDRIFQIQLNPDSESGTIPELDNKPPV